MEQRYYAVMEVGSGGIPVVEVAERYGVSRKACTPGCVATAKKSYWGWPTITPPASPPGQLAAEIEARVCELRRTHPRWASAGWSTNWAGSA